MQLTFTKRAGKHDDLTITRASGPAQAIQCPKQGIIPHDMVHYAVESVLADRGFLSMVETGAAADFTTQGGDSEEAVERLVETFQAELWGGRVAADDLIATYEHACGARGHPAAPVAAADIDAIRAQLNRLSERWTSLAVNEAMTLELSSRGREMLRVPGSVGLRAVERSRSKDRARRFSINRSDC